MHSSQRTRAPAPASGQQALRPCCGETTMWCVVQPPPRILPHCECARAAGPAPSRVGHELHRRDEHPGRHVQHVCPPPPGERREPVAADAPPAPMRSTPRSPVDTVRLTEPGSVCGQNYLLVRTRQPIDSHEQIAWGDARRATRSEGDATRIVADNRQQTPQPADH